MKADDDGQGCDEDGREAGDGFARAGRRGVRLPRQRGVDRLGADDRPRIAGEKLDERRELRAAPDADQNHRRALPIARLDLDGRGARQAVEP